VRRRLLAALAAALLALCTAELGFRALGPRPYKRPTLRDDTGRVVDLGEVIAFFRDGDLQVPAEPRNAIRPGFRARFCYDRPQWDYFDADGCVEVSINALGFRDEEFPLAKPAGELRVLAIGDSFTFAQGCRAEDGWTEVLEGLLAARRGAPVQVMNAGFTGGGSRPEEYAPWMLAHALAFEPDLVIYGMCLNDVDRRVPMLAWEKVWDDATQVGEPWLGGASAVLNFVQVRRRQAQLFASRPPDISALITADPLPWSASQAAIRAIDAHLSEAGVPFLIAVFPMLSLLGDGYPYAGLHTAVARFCAEQGIDTVDLYPRFAGLRDRDLWVHPFDQHPNPAAHRLFAEGLDAHLGR
jgi:lysophospholipase L1-like esterase